MITIHILEKKDIITKGDWCRPLSIRSMSGGHSDSYSFKSMYSGAPENNVKWCRVERIMPFWIGGTVKNFRMKIDKHLTYEFARGNIPKSHRHEDCEAPDYNPEDYQ